MKMEWINVDKRLPDILEEVILTDGKEVFTGHRIETFDEDEPYRWYDSCRIYGVTHWTPLPTPPSKEDGS